MSLSIYIKLSTYYVKYISQILYTTFNYEFSKINVYYNYIYRNILGIWVVLHFVEGIIYGTFNGQFNLF